MATISYTFVERCAAGGHTTFDISINGGEAKRITYVTDMLREPLSELTEQERDQLKADILRIHFAGKTRQQIVTELNQGPVTVTI